MKKLIFIFVLLSSVLLSGMAYGFDVRTGYAGKVTIKNDLVYFKNPYDPPSDVWRARYFKISDLKNADAKFRQCIDDGKFDGLVEIGLLEGEGRKDGVRIAIINNKSTCKRMTHEEYIEQYVITVTGKMSRSGNGAEIKEKGGYHVSFSFDELKDASEEFRKCVDNGKYKGVVEISAENNGPGSGGVRSLFFNTLAVCKRK